MAYKILVTDDLSPQAIHLLEAASDATFDNVHRPSQEELREIIPNYDAVIIRSSVKIDKTIIDNATNLKVIGRGGVGLDNVDINAASLRGIVVLNTPGANTIATAEHTMSMLLALCRNIPQADRSLRDHQWARSQFLGVQLYRKTLGIVGLGRIGAQVARRAQSFSMNVIAFDPFINDEVARELKVELVEFDELLSRADFITLNAASTAETKNLINKKTIARMKPGVRLVNCARGVLVDEAALVEALQSGQIAGAALDVFDKEPLTDNSPLRDLPNVVLTPHIAASTVEAQEDVGTQVVDRVLAALRGDDFRSAVNMPVADASIFRELAPYLHLAEKLGNVQMQLAEGPVKRVEVEFQGDEVSDHVKPLTVALLKGMLDPVTDTPVNYISAPHLAMQRGISVTETKGLPDLNYANLLKCHVIWDGGERFISGSLLGHESPRVVQIDSFKLDAQLEGIILVMESQDLPGVVGQVATLLGKHTINIAEWRMGRSGPWEGSPTSINISFINLDILASSEVLEELKQLDRVLKVTQIKL
ncbi:MAG: phosphoglycerate dehydrogenase [Anaerolineae bacterium]|nr:phosphoglycerate dehydrogenase [Anaerolineae bacterium]